MQSVDDSSSPMRTDGPRNSVTNITSYDVLADPSVEGVVGEYQLDNYKKNVGNNRLKVFLGLYQQEYDRARRQNNTIGCDSIVTNILQTLGKKCVPTGRFLINAVGNNNNNNNAGLSRQVQLPNVPNHQGAGPKPVWMLMGQHESKQLIHGILKAVPPPLAYHRYKQEQLLQQQQQQKQNNAAASRLGKNNTTGLAADEHKRRRRSSLLRRSASDSLLDDSKKVIRFDQQQRLQNGRRMSKEEPTWPSSHRMTKHGIVALNKMDVILTPTMDALDPNSQSIGNNRLHILVAMQSGKYHQANHRQKDSILDEVIQTVRSFWKGRFLTESAAGSYALLDNEDAKHSLRRIFDMRAGQNIFSSQGSNPAMSITPTTISSRLNNNFPLTMGRSSSLNGNQGFGRNNKNNANQFSRNNQLNLMRYNSTSALPIGNNSGAISNDTKKILSRQLSSSLILNNPISSSGPALPRIEPPVALSGINDLRSAAIKSLQKQKARQQVANRLEKVSMRNSQQQLQIHQNLQQANNGTSNMNVVNSNNNNNSSVSSFGTAKRRQSSIFGALDPSVMDEIVDGCFDDEDD